MGRVIKEKNWPRESLVITTKVRNFLLEPEARQLCLLWRRRLTSVYRTISQIFFGTKNTTPNDKGLSRKHIVCFPARLYGLVSSAHLCSLFLRSRASPPRLSAFR